MLLLNNKLVNYFLILFINLNLFYSTMHIYALMDNDGSAITFIDKRFAALY